MIFTYSIQVKFIVEYTRHELRDVKQSRVFAHQIEVKNKYVSVLVGLTISSKLKYCKFNYIIITSPLKKKSDMKGE